MSPHKILQKLATIIFPDFPPHMSKKKALLNFVYYAAKSFPSSFKQITANHIESEVKTGSNLWDAFQTYVFLYNIFFRKKYLLKGYVIRRVAGGYAESYFSNPEKPVLSPVEIKNIPNTSLEAVDNVANISASFFAGVDKDVMRSWLQTYQYWHNSFDLSNDEFMAILKDHLIVELGAGVGANPAVNAQLTREGVLIYDLPVMFHIQRTLIDAVGSEIALSPIEMISDPDELISKSKGKKYAVLSFWGYTEFPITLRDKFKQLIQNSNIALFAGNKEFEGINNLNYFKELCENLDNKSLHDVPISWNQIKSHRYFLIR